MRKVTRTLPIVLPALMTLGLLAVTGRAGKPAPSMPTWVKLTGGIKIESADNTGDPTRVRVTFVDRSINFVPDPHFPDYTTGQFISNPDYSPWLPPDTPSLWVATTGKDRTLQYFFCANNLHAGKGTDDLRCEISAHADYYYCLVISGGKVQKTGAVVFPTGSSWQINKKQNPQGSFAHGTLSMPVTYEVIR